MKVEALNCPNCGAGVASDHSQCEFCKTRLKTMACPACFGLMFVGSQFCQHCGAVAAPVEVSLDGNGGICPRCRAGLEDLQIGETEIRGCEKCDGLWLDTTTFENICADSEKRSAVLVYFGSRTIRGDQLTKVNYVPCPDCGQLMNRNNFAKASGVIVDICKQHGVWFDADELPKIVDFIQKGGMEIARQREKNELNDERARLRDERLILGMQDQSANLGSIFENEDNVSVRNFVRRLFD